MMWRMLWLGFVVMSIVSGCGAPNHRPFQGSSVSWAELLAAAEAKATETDPEAHLVRIGAQSLWWHHTVYSDGLRLSFLFLCPDGEQFFVMLDDTDPSGTIEVIPPRIADPTLVWTPEPPVMDAVLRSVALSPSDVIALTWDEGYPYGSTGRKSDNPSLTLHLSPVERVSSRSPLWSIYYSGHRDGLTLWVDAVTGEIVHREESHYYD